MLLPNKLFSYLATALLLLPEILRRLDQPLTPNELVTQLGPVMQDPIKVIDAIDCLFALGRINLSDEGALYRC